MTGKPPEEAASFSVTPIGIVRTNHVRAEETPIQPHHARGCKGAVIVHPEYVEGLRDIEGFSHLILLYRFHQAEPPALVVRPFLDATPRGVFATRHPRRPNAIGMSVVRLTGREGNALFIEDVDILDGTPVLDIKPYFPEADAPREDVRRGWMEAVSPEDAASRGRRGFQGEAAGGLGGSLLP